MMSHILILRKLAIMFFYYRLHSVESMITASMIGAFV